MKYPANGVMVPAHGSHPVRGAWIEISRCSAAYIQSASHPVRGAWIEMGSRGDGAGYTASSHPVRGAWVEISLRWVLMPFWVSRTP